MADAGANTARARCTCTAAGATVAGESLEPQEQLRLYNSSAMSARENSVLAKRSQQVASRSLLVTALRFVAQVSAAASSRPAHTAPTTTLVQPSAQPEGDLCSTNSQSTASAAEAHAFSPNLQGHRQSGRIQRGGVTKPRHYPAGRGDSALLNISRWSLGKREWSFQMQRSLLS